MTQNLEFKTDSKILSEIFNYVVSEFSISKNKSLPVTDTAVSLESLAKQFIEYKTKEIQEKGDIYTNSIIKEFEENTFLNLKVYNRNQFSDDYSLCKIMLWCSSIKESIHQNISAKERELAKLMNAYGKLERQVSPPLSAYKMVPFNKTDITYSDKSYGLLFE